MQEVSKPIASTKTASQQPDFSIINVNQLSADRGSINEARALSRSFMDLQLPRNQSTQVTNSGHSVSAKAQGILLRISNSRIRKGSICSAGQKRCDRRSLQREPYGWAAGRAGRRGRGNGWGCAEPGELLGESAPRCRTRAGKRGPGRAGPCAVPGRAVVPAGFGHRRDSALSCDGSCVISYSAMNPCEFLERM